MSLHKEPSASDLKGLICARRRCSARTGTGPARAAPRNALPRPLVDGGPGPRAPLVAVEGKACQTATSRRQVGSRCRQCCRRLPAVSRADGGFSRPRRQGTVQWACQGWTLWGGRMDTLLQVVNARPDAQSRCRRAARSRAELVVVWCTCREQKGMPEHTVSEMYSSQLSAWSHQLLRNMCRRDDQACAVQGSWRCTWARPPHLESRHPSVRPTTRELRELKCTIRSLLR